MRKNASSLPSAAMVVALVALVVALGGTGYAATHLGNRGAKHPTAAQTKLFKELAKKVTVANATNAKELAHHPASAYQQTSKLMFATVNTGIHPTIARGRGATKVTLLDPPSGGEYAVTFDRPIAKCTWVASAGSGVDGSSDAVLAVVRAENLTADPKSLEVILFDNFSDGEFIGQGFHIIVACP